MQINRVNNTNPNFGTLYYGNQRMLSNSSRKLLKKGINELNQLEKEIRGLRHGKSQAFTKGLALEYEDGNANAVLSKLQLDRYELQSYSSNSVRPGCRMKFDDPMGPDNFELEIGLPDKINYPLSERPDLLEMCDEIIKRVMPNFISK